MAEVLVLAELNPAGGGVRKTTLEALTAARALGEPSAVVIGAPGTAAGVKDALAEYGAATVYVAESAEVDDYLVAPKAEVLAQLVAARSRRPPSSSRPPRRARRSPPGWRSRPAAAS